MPSPAEPAGGSSPGASRAGGPPAWLWLPELASRHGELVLDGDDAHYVARVCRAAIGDIVTATDGAGAVATLEVLAVRGEVRTRVVTLAEVPAGPRAVVACGAPERDRADWLVEKLAELGVAELQPLECHRGGWERFASRRERFERLATAALRQSRRAWKLRIAEPLPVDAWAAGLPGGSVRWLADAEGERGPRPGAAELEVSAVGPASGFSPNERETLRSAGFRPLRLASARLRTETAAFAWASLWAAGEAATGNGQFERNRPGIR